MHVNQIWRYPVKSMAGERLDEVEVGAGGIPGDRAWAVRDEALGAIVGAKKIAGLMKLGAAYPEPPAVNGTSSPAVIRFEDGSTGSTVDADISERLSTALDRRVTLFPLKPPEEAEHYRRAVPADGDMEQEFRSIFGRERNEPLPDLSVFPPELMQYESLPGTYFDAFPILVLTTKSLESMQQRAPESRFDVRRFRPNFLLEDVDGDGAFPELDWGDRRARIGSVLLQFTVSCPRCVMVTREFDDLPKDPKVMRALVKETGGDMGVYAQVEQPGTVKQGDAFELL